MLIRGHGVGSDIADLERREPDPTFEVPVLDPVGLLPYPWQGRLRETQSHPRASVFPILASEALLGEDPFDRRQRRNSLNPAETLNLVVDRFGPDIGMTILTERLSDRNDFATGTPSETRRR
jgi:hypothetical protein